MNRKLVQHLSSVENFHRTNSLAIDLSNIYGRENIPNRLEMYKFVHKQLGLKAFELVDIQHHPFLPQVYVKVRTEVILTRVETKLKAGVKLAGKNITLYGWRCDVPLTTVKLNGTNPDTTRERIMEVMSQYGEVVACDKGRIDYFKDSHVSDGTWSIRIKPEQGGQGLPSILYYDEGGPTDIWNLIFDGKISCCWKCGMEGHRGDGCRSVRPKTAEQGMTAPVGLGTYCDVVRKGMVGVKWQGMTNQEANLTKQRKLRRKAAEVVEQPDQPVPEHQPLPVQQQPPTPPPPARQQPPKTAAKPAVAKTRPVQLYTGGYGTSSCLRNRFDGGMFGVKYWPVVDTSNRFQQLQQEESEDNEEDEEMLENVETDEGVDSKGRKRVSSNRDSSRGVKTKLDNTVDLSELASSSGGNGGGVGEGDKVSSWGETSSGGTGGGVGQGGQVSSGGKIPVQNGVKFSGGKVMFGKNGANEDVGIDSEGGSEDEEDDDDDDCLVVDKLRQAKFQEALKSRAQF